MKFLTFLIVSLLSLFAQCIYSQQATNWGVIVCDVQLSIGLSNKVITVGPNITLTARIKNSSTNSAFIYVTGDSVYDFRLSLVEGSGKIFEFKPDFPMRPTFGSIQVTYTIEPSKIYECEMKVQLVKSIKTGNYVFKAARSIFIRSNGKLIKCGELVSNLLEVQIE